MSIGWDAYIRPVQIIIQACFITNSIKMIYNACKGLGFRDYI